jgi:hypothetical protein
VTQSNRFAGHAHGGDVASAAARRVAMFHELTAGDPWKHMPGRRPDRRRRCRYTLGPHDRDDVVLVAAAAGLLLGGRGRPARR